MACESLLFDKITKVSYILVRNIGLSSAEKWSENLRENLESLLDENLKYGIYIHKYLMVINP